MTKQHKKFGISIFFLTSLFFFVLTFSWLSITLESPRNFSVKSIDIYFNSTRSMDLIQEQINLGPRIPGSNAIEMTRHLIINSLPNWNIIFQNFSKDWGLLEEVPIVNVICHPPSLQQSEQIFLIMAHYDTRLWATSDPDYSKRKEPVLGANDGASGVAVSLELARVLNEYHNLSNFYLVFFDAEDQGDINGWNWIIGSEYFASSDLVKEINPSFGVLLDMVGARNATFFKEINSIKYAGDLVDYIWDTAYTMNYDNYFVNKSGIKIIDDHLPLLEKGIAAIDIIDDFSSRFTPWHTSFDNITFIDIETLHAVGTTLEHSFVLLNNEQTNLFSLSSFYYTSSFEFFCVFSSGILFKFHRYVHPPKKNRRNSFRFYP